MTFKEALNMLGDGHTIWKVSTAKEICKVVGVPFAKHLVEKFKSDPIGTFKGLTMKPGKENSEGVYALTLSQYVAKYLGVEEKAGGYFGRGSQARAYAEVIEEKIKENIGANSIICDKCDGKNCVECKEEVK
jgi:hypothetical protein